ncbi:MAG: phage antirepressor [Planctomycetota bacterium]|jgi:DNA-damage-inducible protein D|nr:MAG: phage antirepressor [Planctomycetota bacterium]
MSEETGLELIEFEGFHIRRVWDEETERWWFAVVDVVNALTDSKDPNKYWYDMKRREKEVELSAICRKFRMKAANGRHYQTECADTEGMLRIIQSIPSPEAEPFKRWLAKVGYERIQEVENPELAAQRAKALYKAKGYSDEWIEARLRSIDVRKELTDEWKQRGVKEGREYAFLTAEISRGTFGLNPNEHKELKTLRKKDNLRDHMTNAELVFTMLGELSTTEVARHEDAQGYEENEQAARKGGRIAGNARRELEAETGRPVVSSTNYLERPQVEQEHLPSGEEENDEATS